MTTAQNAQRDSSKQVWLAGAQRIYFVNTGYPVLLVVQHPDARAKCIYRLSATGRSLTLMMSLPALAHTDDHGCSAAGVAGNWGFTDTGTVIGIGPRTAVGVFTLDGKGNVVNASATSSLNGSIAVETFSGTYTVNPDCTGTVNVTIYASGVELFTLTMNTAFDDGMREMRGLFTSVTTPSGAALSTVVNLQARKQ